ncbi:hypothetical protein MIZ03_3302 [Rhodoferax lithotrophicus]|uniref:Uncharacterized protein n=1 Tax=Rhodoferax lithotrophicus TaxID=2798804 RepID=A0ABN6D8T0_9BURK|nr:hypothetical protein [Rhodoferax sp. MIZ03]BCO28402.1 hypothetical protein MIZ03_3302 [Rhodoferax sp. MIZ03]
MAELLQSRFNPEGMQQKSPSGVVTAHSNFSEIAYSISFVPFLFDAA